MLTLIRETYGRQSKTVTVSYAKLEGLTGVHRNAIPREIGRLVAMRYVTRSVNRNNTPSTLGVQKDYSKWGSDADSSYSETAISETAISNPVAYSESAQASYSESAQPLKEERKERKIDDVVESRLYEIFGNPKQIKRFVAIAATKRGSFTPDDVDTCEAWLAEQTFKDKVGALVNILNDGRLPIMKRANGIPPIDEMSSIQLQAYMNGAYDR